MLVVISITHADGVVRPSVPNMVSHPFWLRRRPTRVKYAPPLKAGQRGGNCEKARPNRVDAKLLVVGVHVFDLAFHS